LQFINDLKGGVIPKEFIPSIEKGFKSSMTNGVLLGFPVENLKVRLLDGAFHAVDSDQLAFEIVAGIAFKEACKKANPLLLEPIMKLEVDTADLYVGDVASDLNKRRGHVFSIESKIGYQAIKAIVPLNEMFGYVTSLRTITSGRATYSLEFSHYEPTPHEVKESVFYKIKGYLVAV